MQSKPHCNQNHIDSNMLSLTCSIPMSFCPRVENIHTSSPSAQNRVWRGSNWLGVGAPECCYALNVVTHWMLLRTECCYALCVCLLYRKPLLYAVMFVTEYGKLTVLFVGVGVTSTDSSVLTQAITFASNIIMCDKYTQITIMMYTEPLLM